MQVTNGRQGRETKRGKQSENLALMAFSCSAGRNYDERRLTGPKKTGRITPAASGNLQGLTQTKGKSLRELPMSGAIGTEEGSGKEKGGHLEDKGIAKIQDSSRKKEKTKLPKANRRKHS